MKKIKKIFIATLLVVSVSGFAQKNDKSQNQLKKINEKITSIDSKLELNQIQQQKILLVFKEMNVALDDLKKEGVSEQEFSEKSKLIYKEYYAKVHKDILNQEQRNALQKAN